MQIQLTSPIVGDRLELKIFSQKDITQQYISWLNDPSVTKYSNQRFERHNVETARIYLSSFSESNNLFFSIWTREDPPCMIGTITAYINKMHQTADLGIMLGKKNIWGTGYGCEAWKLLIQWLFKHKDIRKITAGTMEVNVGMISVFNKAGMHLEARKVAQELLDSKPIDLLFYAIFNERKI